MNTIAAASALASVHVMMWRARTRSRPPPAPAHQQPAAPNWRRAVAVQRCREARRLGPLPLQRVEREHGDVAAPAAAGASPCCCDGCSRRTCRVMSPRVAAQQHQLLPSCRPAGAAAACGRKLRLQALLQRTAGHMAAAASNNGGTRRHGGTKAAPRVAEPTPLRTRQQGQRVSLAVARRVAPQPGVSDSDEPRLAKQ